MSKPPLPLTALSEAQRTQALERLAIIRPTLEEGITQTQVARTHDLPKSPVQRRNLICPTSERLPILMLCGHPTTLYLISDS